ncbi:MAG: hypothetical protein Q4F24_16865, partial [Eubacteriales bacterium]|nr:hypothetical protein [Eubacteriales bacterium]
HACAVVSLPGEWRSCGKTPEENDPKTVPFESVPLTRKVVHIRFEKQEFACGIVYRIPLVKAMAEA